MCGVAHPWGTGAAASVPVWGTVARSVEVQAAAPDGAPGQALARRGALPVELLDALPAQHAAADQHLAQPFVGARAHRRRHHHGAPVEDELHLLLAVGELEDSRLALLTDQLEYLGDAEVLDVPAQRDRHG